MWLFTPLGFFSIVRKPGESELTISARVRADLEALKARVLPELGTITDHEGTDYPYRAHVAPAAWASALAELGASIDYSNFEDAVHEQQGAERADTYLKVWHVLHGLEKGVCAQRAPSATAERPATPGRTREPQVGVRRAYGGVVIDADGRVLLREPSAHPDGYVWTFPKGVTMAGERDIDAARRVVLEQTGWRCSIVSAVPGWFVGHSSATRFFVMTPLADSGRHEADTARTCWATFTEGAELVSMSTTLKGRERDAAVLREAERVWRIGMR